jgi:hypothetical protein
LWGIDELLTYPYLDDLALIRIWDFRDAMASAIRPID